MPSNFTNFCLQSQGNDYPTFQRHQQELCSTTLSNCTQQYILPIPLSGTKSWQHYSKTAHITDTYPWWQVLWTPLSVREEKEGRERRAQKNKNKEKRRKDRISYWKEHIHTTCTTTKQRVLVTTVTRHVSV